MTRGTVLILAIAVALFGCAAPDVARSAVPASMPGDWSLDATVLVGRDARDAREGAAAHLRPGRYALFPDGSLHYADAADDVFGRGTAWLPPRTRVLPIPELEGVWTLARDLGFTDPTAGASARNLNEIRPPADGRAIVISVAGADVRRVFVDRAADGETSDPAAARLVRHLAALAWADDRTEEPGLVHPIRYDLGPDPYARYRDP